MYIKKEKKTCRKHQKSTYLVIVELDSYSTHNLIQWHFTLF